MRHKVLLALQELPETAGRNARKHGTKAQNVASPANTSVSVPISSAKGEETYVATVNLAKPDAEELADLFADHIARGALILCDRLKSYHSRSGFAGYTTKDCHGLAGEGKTFST